jgi:hypothetical protein
VTIDVNEGKIKKKVNGFARIEVLTVVNMKIICRLGGGAIYTDRNIPTFLGNLLPASVGWNFRFSCSL